MTSKSSTTTTKKAGDLLPLVTPGEILSEEFLKPLDLSMNALALALRIPVTRIQQIVKSGRGISADTALRLSRYFGTSAKFWMNLQTNYELAKARREKLAEIERDVQRRSAA